MHEANLRKFFNDKVDEVIRVDSQRMQEIMEKRTLYGHGLWNVKIWIGLGLVFLILNTFNRSEVSSPFWFSEYILYALMIASLWANQRCDLRKRIAIPRRLAPTAYIFLNWLFGMVYEMGLTVKALAAYTRRPSPLSSLRKATTSPA